MKISLSPDIERLITERIQSGRYTSADEVVREGLELLRAHERELQSPLSNGSQPVAEMFEKIAANVPESEWEKVPADLSKNVERYLSERNRP